MSDTSTPSVALVTGGSRGIGRAVVEALLERGWRVGFCSRTSASLEEALTALRARFPDTVDGRVVDVGDAGAVEVWVEEAEQRLGPVELLVNNAGMGLFAPVDAITPEEWRRLLATNLDGAFHGIRAVAAGMKERGRGWIVNVASLAARYPLAGGAAYNASKFGLLGLSDAAMLDLRPHGIRVAAVLPGSVATDFGHPAGSGAGGDGWRLAAADVARAICDLLDYPERALPSRIELRPMRPGGR